MVLLIPLLAIAELVVIFQMAHVVGWLDTFALLILVSIIGGWLVKRVGLGVIRRFQQALEAHQTPHRELLDGILVLLAGVLLFVPGFITAAAGLLLLLPPVRAGIRSVVARRAKRRFGTGYAVFRGGGLVFGRIIDSRGYEGGQTAGGSMSASEARQRAIETHARSTAGKRDESGR